MYTREKTYIQENYKPRRDHKNQPSFSSTLLDEIYRSIDGNAEKTEDLKVNRAKTQGFDFRATKTNNSGSSMEAEEEMASFTRARLVEKWMEKEKVAAARRKLVPELENKSFQDSDLVFFSSTASSSSDSSGALSSSDTEFFGSNTKSRVSCFSSASKPKPVRTTVSPPGKNKQEARFLFDDYKNHQKNEDDAVKSKSRALKIYANLKKVKQPISPGGKLTSFINSLFNNASEKKSKNVDTNKGCQDLKSPKASSRNCSSTSSFSRSCLSKYSPQSREKMRSGIQRTVRFNPVGVIVGEDSRACGHKSIYGEGSDKFSRPPLPQQRTFKKEMKFIPTEKITSKIEEAPKNGYCSKRNDDYDHNDDDYDSYSDSSSDLFELNHLSFFGDGRFCEELPVYETTRFDRNRVIASGLIR